MEKPQGDENQLQQEGVQNDEVQQPHDGFEIRSHGSYNYGVIFSPEYQAFRQEQLFKKYWNTLSIVAERDLGYSLHENSLQLQLWLERGMARSHNEEVEIEPIDEAQLAEVVLEIFRISSQLDEQQVQHHPDNPNTGRDLPWDYLVESVRTLIYANRLGLPVNTTREQLREYLDPEGISDAWFDIVTGGRKIQFPSVS